MTSPAQNLTRKQSGEQAADSDTQHERLSYRHALDPILGLGTFASAARAAPMDCWTTEPPTRVYAQRCLTPRSSGEPTAWHLARGPLCFIIRPAGQAPHRRLPLSSNVRPHTPHPAVKRVAPVLSIMATVAFGAADAYVFALRWTVPAPQPIAWGQFLAAAALQVTVVIALLLYVSWLVQKREIPTLPSGPLEVLRARFWPAGVLIVLAVLSVDLLHSSLLCGGEGIPQSRGQVANCRV